MKKFKLKNTAVLLFIIMTAQAAVMGFDRQIDFIYELTDEQLKAVFPALDLTLTARAFYLNDGSLIEVEANMLREDALGGGISEWGRIRLAEGEGSLFPSLSHIIGGSAYPPQISYLHGVAVTKFTRVFDRYNASYTANFMLDNIEYLISFTERPWAGQEYLTEIVSQLILGGPADLSVLADPVIPEHFSYSLSFEEARLDPDFGAFVPLNYPDGFILTNIHRSRRQRSDDLSLHFNWSVDYSGFDMEFDHSQSIQWWITEATESNREHIVRPVFQAEELTIDDVRSQTRRMEVNWFHDREPYWQVFINFGVWNDDALIIVHAVAREGNISPEQIWAMFSGVDDEAGADSEADNDEPATGYAAVIAAAFAILSAILFFSWLFGLKKFIKTGKGN